MIAADEFRQYAQEALREASENRSDKDKEALIELARVWWQAASRMELASDPTNPSIRSRGSPRR